MRQAEVDTITGVLDQKFGALDVFVAGGVLARVLLCRVTSFVETQADGLSMAARGCTAAREMEEIVVEARTSLTKNGDDHCGPP